MDLRGIETLSSGSYRVKRQIAGRLVRKTFKTLEAALAFRDAVEAELAHPDVEVTDGYTLATWADHWFMHLRFGSSARNDRNLFGNHIAKHPIARKPLKALRPADVTEWLDWLKRRKTSYRDARKKTPTKLSWYTRRNVFRLMSVMIRDAFRRGHCPTNPCLGLTVEKVSTDVIASQVNEDWPLRPAEQEALWKLSSSKPEILIALCAIGTGLRQGELYALHLADVHLDDPSPWVHVKFGGKGKLPKKGKKRKVPLFGPGLEAFKRWLEFLPSYAPHNPLGLAFPTPKSVTPNGRKYKGGAWRQIGKVPPAWTFAKKDILKRHVRWHWLRHTCATSMICGWWGQKWSLHEAGKMLGHSDVETTQMYAHLLDSELSNLAATANQAWEERQLAPKVPVVDAETSTERPNFTQDSVTVNQTPNFLNRWSDVRIVSGAPNDSGHLEQSDHTSRGQSVDADGLVKTIAMAAEAGQWDVVSQLAEVLKQLRPAK